MKYFEQIVWSIALILLFFMDNSSEAASVCVFKFAGFNSCWGCGIGHAIHDVLHLKFIQSLSAHIMGIPATFGILMMIFKPESFYKIRVKPIISPKTTLNNGSGRIHELTGNPAR